ncbi:hypothetical protein BDV59DRAFT_158133 [Aspergillus ambiguus]|uniref:uncharacterized protein n=1 Tax=Aspergillus ambiguus TaxID=176160 RepID=UPI003CCE30DC
MATFGVCFLLFLCIYMGIGIPLLYEHCTTTGHSRCFRHSFGLGGSGMGWELGTELMGISGGEGNYEWYCIAGEPTQWWLL